MTNFQVTKGVTGERIDTRWRASAHGEDSARPGQITPSDFASVAVDFGGKKVIPSGVALKKSGAKYVPVTAAGDVIAGYLNDDQGVTYDPSQASAPHTIAVLVHGFIKASVLPVTAQRALVVAADAKTTGLFTYVED